MSTSKSYGKPPTAADAWQARSFDAMLRAAFDERGASGPLSMLTALRLATLALDGFGWSKTIRESEDFKSVYNMVSEVAGLEPEEIGTADAPRKSVAYPVYRDGNYICWLMVQYGDKTEPGAREPRHCVYFTRPNLGAHVVVLDSLDESFYREALTAIGKIARERGDAFYEAVAHQATLPPHSRKMPDAGEHGKGVAPTDFPGVRPTRNGIEEMMLAEAHRELEGPGGRAGAVVGKLRGLLAADASASEMQEFALQVARWVEASRYLLGLSVDDDAATPLIDDLAEAVDAPTLAVMSERIAQIVNDYDAAVQPGKPGKPGRRVTVRELVDDPDLRRKAVYLGERGDGPLYVYGGVTVATSGESRFVSAMANNADEETEVDTPVRYIPADAVVTLFDPAPEPAPKPIPSVEEQKEMILRAMAEDKARRIAAEPGGLDYYVTVRLLDILRHDLRGPEVVARLENLARDIRTYGEFSGGLHPEAVWVLEQVEQAAGPEGGNKWERERRIRSIIADGLTRQAGAAPAPAPGPVWLRVGADLVRADAVVCVRFPQPGEKRTSAGVHVRGQVFVTDDPEQIDALRRWVGV